VVNGDFSVSIEQFTSEGQSSGELRLPPKLNKGKPTRNIGHTNSFFVSKVGKTKKNVASASQSTSHIHEVSKCMIKFCPERKLHHDDLKILLNDHASASSAYLNDTIMLNFGYILNDHLKNDKNFAPMQDTLNYKTNGMIPHETARNIIQPIHSGDLHWSMVTTIGLSQAEKLNTIILYDSMTQFKDDGTPDIKPRVAWQAAQLLRATNNGSSIFIEVRACHQQINLVDCGMFAVANSVSLALGLNPGEVLYEPTF
jgi:Ulp1 family protease